MLGASARAVLRRAGRGACRSCAYGEWAKASETTRGSSDGGIAVFGAYADEYDAARPAYPAPFWDDIEAECRSAAAASPSFSPSTSLGTALDVAAGTGRGAFELVRRGCWESVVAVDLDKGMLQQARRGARDRGLPELATMHAAAEDLGEVADGSVDLLVCLQAFHWFEPPAAALAEFRRVLAPGRGRLVIAWNDRDLSVPWVRELEDLVEAANPRYSRWLKQASHVTEQGAIFPPARFAAAATAAAAAAASSVADADARERAGGIVTGLHSYANTSEGCTADTLVELMDTMSYLRNALDEPQRATFQARLREMVAARHGDAPFALPWVTNAYFLRPVP